MSGCGRGKGATVGRAWKEVLGLRVRGASTLFALSPEGSQPGMGAMGALGGHRGHTLGWGPGHSSQAQVLGAGGGSQTKIT